MPKPIIAAVDPLREDVAPAALGLLLARLTGAPLVLAAIYRIDIYVDSSYPEYASASRRDAEQAMSRVADLAARAPGGPAAVTTTVTPAVGSATRALHDLAEREQASLVAIGSSGRGRVGRVLPGAVPDRLLHGAPCPLAVAPVGFSFEDAAAVPRLIGVAFTDTPDGHAALSTACVLAVRAYGFVRVLTVAEPLHPMMTATLDAMALEEVRSARGAEAEANLRRGLDFVSASRSAGGEILSGDPSDALAAASADLDLLVCGSQGYGPMRTLVVGGTSDALVRKAVCPVLVVPPSSTSRSNRHRQRHAHWLSVARPVTGTHDLGTQRRVLDDGRRVTLRHAVPSDAPRLTLLGSEFDGDDGRVALDDHGRIVGHAGHTAAPIILDDWAGSGLAPLLARNTSDN